MNILLSQGQHLVPVGHDPFSGPVIERSYPTTAPQREVWTAASMGDQASCAYNESVSLYLEGPLDSVALGKAWDQVVERHEGMRTVFVQHGLTATVLQRLRIPTELHDLSTLAPEKARDREAELGLAAMHTPFDLANGPLFRFMLFRTGPTEHRIRIIGHHLMCDGWSLGIIMADLARAYNTLRNGSGAPAPQAIPYSRYAMAMDAFARSAGDVDVERYWTGVFAGEVPVLDLPTDRPRPADRTWTAQRIDIPVPMPTVQRLRSMATAQGSSFVTTLLSVFELLIAATSGQRDLVVGLPAAGQSDMGMKQLVGHCVSLLPLRTRIRTDQSFASYLNERRTAVLDAFEHQRFTFSTLLQRLNITRDPARVPLVPVVFNVDMDMDDGVAFQGIRHRYASDPRSFEQFELTLNVAGSGDRLTMEWSYNADLFHEATIREWMERMLLLMELVAERPERPVQELLDRVNRSAAVPAAWQAVRKELPAGITVAHLFDAAARAHPHNRALVQGSTTVDHATLRDRVDALAMRLMEMGAAPGMFIGLCAEPGPDLITGQMAIVRSGAAFVPMDPAYPDERLAQLISSTGMTIALVDAASIRRVERPGLRTLLLDDMERAPVLTQRPPLRATPDDPVYMIHTSGSTGTPKGVPVPHRGIVRLVSDQDFFRLGPDRVFHHHMSISFDAAQLSIMCALLHGGTLVIGSGRTPSLPEIAESITRHGVNTMATPAGIFKLLVETQLHRLKGLEHLMVGGDVLPVAHARKALEVLGPGVLINGYGPTEDSVMCTTFTVRSAEDLEGNVPIGKPLTNAPVYVLDEQGHPVAVGQRGELYLGGPGVALGYHGLPEQSAEAFLPDPFSNEADARMYRTGDLVRWRADGNLEFLGRVDDQVKVRGFRVEPREVDAALDQLHSVKDKLTVALAAAGGEKALHLYVVPRNAELASDPDGEPCSTWLNAVEEHLTERLPEHMRPSSIQVLSAIPLNRSGKPDKAALPAPQVRTERSYTAPRSTTEKLLADLWARTLKVEQVGLHDNFFELGGHSLLGIRLFAKVEDHFGVRLPVQALFRQPTIAGLARLVDEEKSSVAEHGANSYLTAMQAQGDASPFFCVYGDEANVFLPKYLGADRPYYAVFHQGEDGLPIAHTEVEDMAREWIKELKRVKPFGPYLLGGYSFGGIVAFEMARQLSAQGDEVPVLALFDTYAPADGIRSAEEDSNGFHPLKNGVMRMLVREFHRHGKVLPGKLRHFNIIDTYDRATRRYRPGTYGGDLTLLRATASPGAHDMGWGALVEGEVRVIPLAGDHYSIIKEPHVRALGKALAELLDHHDSLVAMPAYHSD